MSLLKRLLNEERGNVALIVALSSFALLGLGTMAVDLGVVYTKRSQMQKAADIAALAGAQALINSSGNTDMARTQAITTARANLAQGDVPDRVVRDGDVTFSNNAAINTSFPMNRIDVHIRRNAEAGNSVGLIFANLFGDSYSDLTVMARAEAVPACRSCVAPLSVPDKFTWNDKCDPDRKLNNGALDPTSSCEMASVQLIGYSPADFGTPVVLKFGDPTDTVVPGWFSPINLPPVGQGAPETGASVYRERLGDAGFCMNDFGTYSVQPGSQVQVEPGNMVGPTRQGIADLLAGDPAATWDTGKGVVTASGEPNPHSPRIIRIPLYDPRLPIVSGRNYLTVVKVASFFVESMDNQNNVRGRYIASSPLAPWGTVSPGASCLTYTARLARP